MVRSIVLIALWLITQTAFAQSIAVTAFEAQLAKSIKVEQLTDSVAVIFSDKIGTKTGAYLQVTSDKKWATPVYDGIEITQTKNPGEWIMFAPGGKYRVLLAEFDPETGPRYTYHDVVIGKPSVPDVPPTDPPSSDFSSLTKVAKEAADKLNDPPTRDQLVFAYKAALTSMAGKPYDDARAAVTTARFAVLNARKGASRDVDWKSWLQAVDAELVKSVPAGNADKYRGAIEAIIKGLGG